MDSQRDKVKVLDWAGRAVSALNMQEMIGERDEVAGEQTSVENAEPTNRRRVKAVRDGEYTSKGLAEGTKSEEKEEKKRRTKEGSRDEEEKEEEERMSSMVPLGRHTRATTKPSVRKDQQGARPLTLCSKRA
uniref:Uncharacterized protein n=1 Tax=Coccidioides posadasii RMSCC 3488 TaxID=454284 RepID=A0A0J6FAS7_COCPO|nr:hypothetical protein CPAG_02699 [Coccidioides posadasii RMSCC 3488]